MKLVDLKTSKADREKQEAKYSAVTGSDYPYGLSMHLEEDTLAKLDVDGLDAGVTVRLYAEATVSSLNVNKRDGSTERSMSLQITKMAIVSEDDTESTADDMYGKKG